MSYQLNLNGDLSRDILKDFAKYIIPYIRDFSDSAEGRKYINTWIKTHPEYETDDNEWYYYDDEDEDEL